MLSEIKKKRGYNPLKKESLLIKQSEKENKFLVIKCTIIEIYKPSTQTKF